MKTFQDFLDLPKDQQIGLLKVGLEYNFQQVTLKTKPEWIEYRTSANEPNEEGIVAESIHLNQHYDFVRMVYYYDVPHLNNYAPVRNQVQLFQSLRQRGFIE